MSDLKRTILVTSALPYANGPIHLGHLLEYIQTDIWVRFQQLRGHKCTYVCADDAHGTAIMLKAEENGISPEQQIATVQAEHEKDFDDFLIHFDNYSSTHSEENRVLSTSIYQKLFDKKYIIEKEIKQLFDPEKKLFLADRFVKGTCPKCKAENQYGDNCEVCSGTYSANELIEPRSTISGTTPVEKNNIQLFFDLPQFQEMLKEWTKSGTLQSEIANKLHEWLETGLKPWDISREAPYFGFEIPTHPGKYLYVWLDAPIGYMAAFENLCNRCDDLEFDDYWAKDSQYELYHFIGKDIINFHGLFWPAMLTGAGYRTPNAIFAHGFVMVNGDKMSKSRGTFIKARTYLEHLQAEYLRYYFAAKLTSKVDDFDLNLDDFTQRVNSDLVGKVINIASRCAKFVTRAGGELSPVIADETLWQEFTDASESIALNFENREFGRAIREIMALADKANQYIAEKAPWQLAKQEGQEQEVLQCCSFGINLFRVLIIYLKPVLPELGLKTEQFLNVAELKWSDSQEYLGNHVIGKFKPMMQRIENDKVAAMVNASKEEPSAKTAPAKSKNKESSMINFEDFAKVEMTVARIAKAELVNGADKLLQLTLDLGDREIKVFAGIKAAYSPEDITGRLTIAVTNLEPRKMKFGVSEGMVLAAGPGGEDIHLLSPDDGATPGMRVK